MAIRGGDWLASAPRALVLIYGGLCLTLAGVILQTADFGQELGRDFGLRLLFRLRGTLPPPDRVSVVSINDSAAQRMGLPAAIGPYQRCEDLKIGALPPAHRQLPPASRVADWPRCVHARLVDALHAMGASTIVFDLTFRERDPFVVDGEDVRATQDEQLAGAMRQAKNVFLATKVYETLDQANPQLSSGLSNINAATLTQAIRREALGIGPYHIADVKPPYGRVYLYSKPDTPRPSVLVLAMLFQLRQAYPDVLREISGGTSPAWGLPATQAELFVPGELEATTLQLRQLLRSPGNGVPRYGRTTKSAESAAQRWISTLASEPVIQTNFYGPPGTLDTLSYEDLLLPAASEAMKKKIKGRAVFIGYSESARPEQLDHFESYFARGDGVHFSGVELAATVFANLLDGSQLRRAPTALALFIVALLAFVPLGISLYWPTAMGFLAAAGTGAVYLVAALVLFRAHNSWLPIVIPLGIVEQQPYSPIACVMKKHANYWVDSLRIKT
ncbi:MAG: CHASE2 domain-containing protein [Betaproteobacteria bacterium]|nr:CHASE2 domain-containing protein [Betaproteobacteria bacterium]